MKSEISNSRVKSVKIWSRNEMSDLAFKFGFRCFESFKDSIDKNEYGENWKECAYSNDYFCAFAKLTKSGQASIMVYEVD